MVCDQDIAKGTFAKEEFDDVHLKFEAWELNNIKTGNQPQDDIVRSDYKTNKEVKIMAILLHVGKPIEPIN